jgi:release factor glutamine methyltransferase
MNSKKDIQKELHWVAQDKYKGEVDPSSLPEKDIKRIMAGEPVDYVIGWKPFLDCIIDLSQKPLIPRVETEYWAEKFIEKYRDSRFVPSSLRFLDMFSGAGCLGVAILTHIPNAHVDFVDSEPNCIKQIRINLKQNHIDASRTRVIRSNIFSNIPTFLRMSECRYDAIVANPPYVALQAKRTVQSAVLRHEPHVAVFGGQNGLRYIEPFLRDAKKHLKPSGEIWMEFNSRISPLKTLTKKYGYSKIEFKKDQYGKIRYAIIGSLA